MKARVFLLIISLSCISYINSQNLSNAEPPKKCVNGKHFIYSTYYGGRLGNQLFQIAAALSLAMDNDAEAVFPDYLKKRDYDIPENRKNVFPRLNFIKPLERINFVHYEDKDFNYRPIPYSPNMKIFGFFQSEKFFKHNFEKIAPYFEPEKNVARYIEEKYLDLLSHPCTVAVHLRGYLQESMSLKKMFTFAGLNYVEEAASLFPEEALFVVFSDQMDWAKEELRNFSRPHIFIEGEKHYVDFYLMSFMKHQIVANSSFSWWAAYLNKNPDKIVVAPYPWFQLSHHLSNEFIIPDDWIKIELKD